jgi:hypothetical protein
LKAARRDEIGLGAPASRSGQRGGHLMPYATLRDLFQRACD